MRAGDAAAVRAVERRAGEAFRTVDLSEIADHEPPPEEVLRSYVERRRAWVVVDGQDAPVGHLLLDVVDGCTHVEQVTVDPERQGQGLGRALLARAARWAEANGHAAVTLTTYDDVPWNRPLYEHLGFRVLDEEQLGPELRALRAHEATQGLDPARRVCMRLEVPPG